VVAGHHHHYRPRQVWSRLGGDAGNLRRQPLQAAQAAGRLGQLVLPQARLELGWPIERRDLRHDF
jgi:hypothetical protein